MRPDTGPFLALSPFRTPVPLPTQDPDGSPNIAVTIACSWLPYIRGALFALTMQYTWPQGDPDAVLLAQQRAMSLIALFVECSEPIPPISCNYDIADSPDGWTITSPYDQGTYTGGQGYVGTFVSTASQRALTIDHAFTSPSVVTHVEFAYDSDQDGDGPNNFIGIFIDSGSGPVLMASDTVHFGADNILSWSGEVDGVVDVLIQMNSGTFVADYRLTRAQILGLSTDPCT